IKLGHVEGGEQARVGHDFHHHVRLTVIETAFYRRAHAWRDRRVAYIHVERHVDAGRPRASQLHRLFDDGGDALAIDIFHGEDMHVGVLDGNLLAVVKIADADEHRVRRQRFWGEGADPR